MFCSNCGEKALEGALFCGNCGRRLSVSATAGVPSALQQDEPVNRQDPDFPHLDAVAALRRVFARFGTGLKCVQPLSLDVCQGDGVKSCTFPFDEKPLALFGTEKKGEFRGILVTDTSVRWKICEAGSDTKWCEGRIEHAKIASIGLVMADAIGLFVVNDKVVGVFATGRKIMDGERKTDDNALAAAIEFCKLVTVRAPVVKQSSHSVEWLFNGRIGDKPPRPYFSYVVIGLCILMYLGQWAMGAFDSDEKFVTVVKSMGGEVPVLGYLVCGFMHSGLIHLVCNLLGLATICASAEKVFGTGLFAVVYLASVLGGGFGAEAMDSAVVSVGASGGLFGIMGAICVFGAIRFSMMGKRLSGFDRRKVYNWVKGYGALLMGNLYFTFQVGRVVNISIGGHIGGLIVGFVLGFIALMLVPLRREQFDEPGLEKAND